MSASQKIMTIYKVLNLSSAHQLFLPYESKCNRLHGHNFKVEIWITGLVDEHGMVVDFYLVKKEVMKLDHQNLNDFIKIPTAENIAYYLTDKLLALGPDRIKQIKIKVWETDTAYAEYQTKY
ncbi:MAG: 6-pyruvoyl trahydropterin synthase family protein [Candidatus Kariarchaeaceae archaeon]|jgi:6-pyruvoyltetrahydropterin/6-carboxytetrahydropterin synthase